MQILRECLDDVERPTGNCGGCFEVIAAGLAERPAQSQAVYDSAHRSAKLVAQLSQSIGRGKINGEAIRLQSAGRFAGNDLSYPESFLSQSSY
jgi:hypothetical protein